ncbi:MAG: methyltransferase domain-containing protein [Candidatus Diapherotrites archaeon]|nr:methyltransferase domain-containing protein [Candidatus Diapherotrites archaeon]
MKCYSDFYRTRFGKEVLEREALLVANELKGCEKILSAGCGPAFLESRLKQLSKAEVTGLEQNPEMLKEACEKIEAVRGNAEKMQFASKSFDCILFVTSLEFIQNYKKAVAEAARILNSNGRILALILNPESAYFKEHAQRKSSYFRKIKHTNLRKIKGEAEKFFSIEGSYCLGIKDKTIFDSSDKKTAVLYVLKGIKKGERLT